MGHQRKRRATDQVAPAQGTSSRGYATSAQDNLNLYSIARETNDILNLVTSCVACNSGKGARKLSDTSVVEAQRKQLEELEERRQQLEMMLAWRDGLDRLNESVEQMVSDKILDLTGYRPNERGMQTVRRWIKNFPLAVILDCIPEAFDRYGDWRDGDMTEESWTQAINKVSGFCRNKIEYGSGPDVDQMLYIQGIVRKRIGDPFFKALDGIKAMRDVGHSLEDIKTEAKSVVDEDDFQSWVHQ